MCKAFEESATKAVADATRTPGRSAWFVRLLRRMDVEGRLSPIGELIARNGDAEGDRYGFSTKWGDEDIGIRY